MAKTKEPNTAPQAEHSYPLTLGSSLADDQHSSSRFYSLRYEFKPASIDTSRPGSLQKGLDNKVTVEFSNNQPGKPKVAFQGNIEECKDLDAVIFFDGRSFRLERLHRAVKSLRHVRQPGEAALGATTSVTATAGPNGDPKASPMHLNGAQSGSAHVSDKGALKMPLIRDHVEEIVIGKPDTPAQKKHSKKAQGEKMNKKNLSKALSPDDHKRELHELSKHLDGADGAEKVPAKKAKVDNSEKANDVIVDEEVVEEHESDYILEDIDASEEEDGEVNKAGTDPVAILRAQAAANAAATKQSSSGSETSGSSSGSGSDGSSSESAGTEDDEDSGSSGADI
ncbi:hypothetical protein O6H91_05G041600 [Diphasiastrum complanatum]|uniref:Uncharacterized protein n=1 Tax=Diphasiastrum complanatum TaxID=34168 RepID=A0ACC2DMK8_DIPCM|nr:hypothetical protein O6H91_05G041600 [Diphasiastrum complanatum]